MIPITKSIHYQYQWNQFRATSLGEKTVKMQLQRRILMCYDPEDVLCKGGPRTYAIADIAINGAGGQVARTNHMLSVIDDSHTLLLMLHKNEHDTNQKNHLLSLSIGPVSRYFPRREDREMQLKRRIC